MTAAWYILDDDDWTPERGYRGCRAQHGPFATEAEAKAFRDEPANAYDELGPVVRLDHTDEETDMTVRCIHWGVRTEGVDEIDDFFDDEAGARRFAAALDWASARTVVTCEVGHWSDEDGPRDSTEENSDV